MGMRIMRSRATPRRRRRLSLAILSQQTSTKPRPSTTSATSRSALLRCGGPKPPRIVGVFFCLCGTWRWAFFLSRIRIYRASQAILRMIIQTTLNCAGSSRSLVNGCGRSYFQCQMISLASIVVVTNGWKVNSTRSQWLIQSIDALNKQT